MRPAWPDRFWSGRRAESRRHVERRLYPPRSFCALSGECACFPENRIGQLEGRVEWHGAARGALAFSADGRDIHLPNLSLRTLHAKLEGARAQHALTLNTAGRLLNQPLELQMSARG